MCCFKIIQNRAFGVVVFLFLLSFPAFFAVSVYAEKPVAPIAQTSSAINITSNSADLVCTVTAGSQAAEVYFVRESPAPVLGLTWYSVPAFSAPVDYSWTWQGLQPSTYYAYSCYAANSLGTSEGVVRSFTTLSAVSDPPLCTFTASPISVALGSSTIITYNSALADTFEITWPNNSMNVTPNVQGSFSDSPAVSTTYTGTVINNGGIRTCNVTVTVGKIPPQSVTVGAAPSRAYTGFDFQCSYMFGTSPTRLFMRLTSGGVVKDYEEYTVSGEQNYTEFLLISDSTYSLYPLSGVPLYWTDPVTLQEWRLNLTILNENTLYQYQCCAENSYGLSCGNTGSIYTLPYAISFDYDYNPSWPHLVSYGRSIWALSVEVPAGCFVSYTVVNFYGMLDDVLRPFATYDLVYDITGDGIPEKNANSNFSLWDLNHNGYLDVGDDHNAWNYSDAYRWDTNKDGILDRVDAGSGNPICGVIYVSGHEHFLTCPRGYSIGKMLFATVAFVLGSGDCLSANVGDVVIIPFGDYFFGVGLKDKGFKLNYKQGRLNRAGRIGFGAGGFERVIQ